MWTIILLLSERVCAYHPDTQQPPLVCLWHLSPAWGASSQALHVIHSQKHDWELKSYGDLLGRHGRQFTWPERLPCRTHLCSRHQIRQVSKVFSPLALTPTARQTGHSLSRALCLDLLAPFRPAFSPQPRLAASRTSSASLKSERALWQFHLLPHWLLPTRSKSLLERLLHTITRKVNEEITPCGICVSVRWHCHAGATVYGYPQLNSCAAIHLVVGVGRVLNLFGSLIKSNIKVHLRTISINSVNVGSRPSCSWNILITLLVLFHQLPDMMKLLIYFSTPHRLPMGERGSRLHVLLDLIRILEIIWMKPLIPSSNYRRREKSLEVSHLNNAIHFHL